MLSWPRDPRVSFVATRRKYVNAAIPIDLNIEVDRPTTNLTIFDVVLLRN